jgi:hypothetical protein
VCILDVTNNKDEDDILMRNAADDDNYEEDVQAKMEDIGENWQCWEK